MQALLGREEASPSPVYGARLLSGFRLIPVAGSNPAASAIGISPEIHGQTEPGPGSVCRTIPTAFSSSGRITSGLGESLGSSDIQTKSLYSEILWGILAHKAVEWLEQIVMSPTAFSEKHSVDPPCHPCPPSLVPPCADPTVEGPQTPSKAPGRVSGVPKLQKHATDKPAHL